MKIRTIIVKFNTEIKQHEVPLFRGAINSALEEGRNILFHNHVEDGLRFSYPLIQYKRIGGKAAIFCIGEGASAINELFEKKEITLQIGKRSAHCEEYELIAKHYEIGITEELHSYRIRKWNPFNSENYQAYMEAKGIVEKCQILEKIMIGNILSMGKGLGITIESPLDVSINEIIDLRNISFKGVKMMSFDVDFMANISLPDYCGLGKGVSHGFGTITNR